MKNKKAKNNKVVAIVGNGGGIGRAISKIFLEAGWIVFGFDKKRSGLEGGKNSVFELVGDITLEKDVEKLFKFLEAKAKLPDAVIFAQTAPLELKSLTEKNWKDFEKNIAVSAKGLFLFAKLLSKSIKEGHKIRFTVIATEGVIGRPSPYMADYLVGKQALVGLAKSLAVEFGKWGSTVNIVSPGFIDTSLIRSFPDKVVEAAAIGNPMRRIGKSDEVAKAVFFLSGEESEYINGAHLTVNGGNIMF